MKALTILKERLGVADKGEDPVAIEGELSALRAKIGEHEAEAERLGDEWRDADGADAAAQIDRRRREMLRLIERDSAKLPGLEARLQAAKDIAQADALARHRATLAGIFPRLRKALDAAAAVQLEAIAAADSARREIGALAEMHLQPVVYLGFVLPDLIALWAAEQERIWAPKAPAPRPPAPTKPKAEARANGHAAAPPPAPKVKRAPRIDPPPEIPGQCSITFIRGGIELPDGSQSVVGDHITMPQEAARGYLQRGVADVARDAAQ